MGENRRQSVVGVVIVAVAAAFTVGYFLSRPAWEAKETALIEAGERVAEERLEEERARREQGAEAVAAVMAELESLPEEEAAAVAEEGFEAIREEYADMPKEVEGWISAARMEQRQKAVDAELKEANQRVMDLEKELESKDRMIKEYNEVEKTLNQINQQLIAESLEKKAGLPVGLEKR